MLLAPPLLPASHHHPAGQVKLRGSRPAQGHLGAFSTTAFSRHPNVHRQSPSQQQLKVRPTDWGTMAAVGDAWKVVCPPPSLRSTHGTFCTL